jgi:hypothetical protein
MSVDRIPAFFQALPRVDFGKAFVGQQPLPEPVSSLRPQGQSPVTAAFGHLRRTGPEYGQQTVNPFQLNQANTAGLYTTPGFGGNQIVSQGNLNIIA